MVLVNTWARSRAEAVEQDLLVAYLVIHNRAINEKYVGGLIRQLGQQDKGFCINIQGKEDTYVGK